MLGREKNCNRREMLTKFYFVVGVGEGRPDLDPIRTQYGAFVYWQHVTLMYTGSWNKQATFYNDSFEIFLF